METIISSLKRPNGFKGILALLFGLLLPIIPSCEKNPSGQDILVSPSASTTAVKITYGKVKDIDGNVYKTVKIGKQTWMAENLKTTKLNNGTPISFYGSDGELTESPTPRYCWFGYDASNRATYGALYNWHAVNTGRLCPQGWHVPSDAEWTTLTNYLGGAEIAGDKLREAGQTHWENNGINGTNATNAFGFTALPGGAHIWSVGITNYFWGLRIEGYWWTSTEDSNNTDLAWLRYMAGDVSEVDIWTYKKKQANSIRCLNNK
jgi:uncharacterized protein (TIGR02145 family)